MKCILKLVIVVTAILSAFPLLSAQDADSAARGRTQEEMHIRYRVAKANIEKNKEVIKKKLTKKERRCHASPFLKLIYYLRNSVFLAGNCYFVCRFFLRQNGALLALNEG